jgi:hypothetical protein
VGFSIKAYAQAARTTTQGREELQPVLDFLREGDVLMSPGSTDLREASETSRTSVRAVRAKGA